MKQKRIDLILYPAVATVYLTCVAVAIPTAIVSVCASKAKDFLFKKTLKKYGVK